MTFAVWEPVRAFEFLKEVRYTSFSCGFVTLHVVPEAAALRADFGGGSIEAARVAGDRLRIFAARPYCRTSTGATI
jgi:hypothetical protein